MVPYMGPIFIELLSRRQRPPSTQSLIANAAAMESSALALSGLCFEFPLGLRCGGENPLSFVLYRPRNLARIGASHTGLFAPYLPRMSPLHGPYGTAGML